HFEVSGEAPAYGPPPASYGPPTGDYGYDFGARSPPPGSYYIEDVPQHFYKWSSPPGLVRLLEGAVMLLCIAVFACVASTLAWDYGYGYGGVLGTGLGGFYGSGYYGSGVNYGYGYGGYYGGVTNPRAANGFMIAMAVLCFLAQLGLLVASLSKSSSSRSRRFYLVVIVVCAVLALVMLVASIVYVVGVNPQAQMSGGGYYYSPLLAMCSQVYAGGTVLNQYLYHYCTVDPQEAVAIACGFLTVLLLCLICVLAHKTRSKIWKYGKHNIYWDKIPAEPQGPDVEEWVRAASATPGASPPSCHLPRFGDVTPFGDISVPRCHHSLGTHRVAPRRGQRRKWHVRPDVPKATKAAGTGVRHKQPTKGRKEGDRGQPDVPCPPVGPPQTSGGVTLRVAPTASPVPLSPCRCLSTSIWGFGALAEEYNHLKDVKRSPEYQDKKRESKTLRNKLFHIKRMVSDYDKLRG
uniref:MARVEL domain-containing protein n=1 Tax=Junco hyemalis TaxID=40217 RepID=A0A8C5IS78_JUNHY